MAFNVDDDSALLAAYNLPLLVKRRVQELHGLAAAIVFDGVVSDEEVAMLMNWLGENDGHIDSWPAAELRDLICEVIADGVVTPEERLLLFDLLSTFAATKDQVGRAAEGLFDAVENADIRGLTFLFTGTLCFGQRSKAQAAVVRGGGEIASGPNYRLGFLVVGDLGSENWQMSRYGRKIETVMNNRTRGATTRIIDERTFVRLVIAADGCEKGATLPA